MTSIPDFDLNRVRNDFEAIFDLNSVTCKIVRESNVESGDLFNETTSSTQTQTNVKLNIQGISSIIQRANEGVTTKDLTLNAFAKYNTDLQENDIVIVSTSNIALRFKIDNFAPGMKGDNQYVFKEFTLRFISYDQPAL